MKFGGQIRNIVVNFRSDRSLGFSTVKMATVVVVAVLLSVLLQGIVVVV